MLTDIASFISLVEDCRADAIEPLESILRGRCVRAWRQADELGMRYRDVDALIRWAPGKGAW
jgi:hypothetical protein